MASSLLLRRRATLASGWTPNKLAGITAYWNADDVAGSNGASIASWTDRIGSVALAQATGAKQPTLVTSSGSTGHKALRFTAANSQIMTAARGSIPNQAPVWCWVVHRMASNAAQNVLAEVATPSTNNGWLVQYNGSAQPQIGGWNVAFWGTGGDPTATSLWREFHWDPTVNQKAEVQRNNLPSPVTTSSVTSQAISGGTTVSVGGSSAKNLFFADTEIQLVLIGTGFPSTADRLAFAAWLYKNYGILTGTGYNALAAVTTTGKNRDGTASSSAIELGVAYNPAGIFGHNYWMAWAPYDGSLTSNENPNIGFSDDGNTWATTGITNPIVAWPGGGAAGNNADPSLLDNTARDSKLYCIYVVENNSTAANNGVFVRSSTDGVTWSAATQIVSGDGGNFYESPVIAYDSASGTYWLWNIDLTGGVIYRQTCATLTGTWSAQTACSLTVPGSRKPWHMSQPVKIGTRWVTAFSDSDSTRNVWLASSTDGLTWACAARPLVVPGLSNFDNNGLYRPAIQDAGDGTNLLLWYVTGLSQPAQLSQKVTVPQAQIP